ncbi:MAG: transitional endoplasmic reticulum ATPase [Acidimicrobiaceae bacterium]|jgi:transitional endoplasmic reticulum ATPase
MLEGRILFDILLGAIAGIAVAALVLALARRRETPADPAPSAVAQSESVRTAPVRGADVDLVVLPPDRLPKFADIGGLDDVKAEMRDTLGLVLRDPERANTYRVTWNGVLLHGLPGTGKSFFARALAGELGCSLLEVDVGDLVSSTVGDAPRRVHRAFETAATHLPCVLLFDELDAVATARGDQPDGGGRDLLAQLLQSVEQWRQEPRLVVVATTNDLDALDPAITRAGRFDRHVRLDLPDEKGRLAILEAALRRRPVRSDLDLSDTARRCAGHTPASLVQAVELAALHAMREATGTSKVVQISADHLDDAIEQRGGKDRPTVDAWSWDQLVLDAHVLAELRKTQELIEDPERSERLGIDPPSGLLLTGPPGTGKTTIAKVLAAEARCSFYPVTAADLTSRWVGESEKAMARLFRRARANCPSIVFIDEIDAIGGTRGRLGAYDRQLDQLLLEIDGMSSAPGVFVIGATNRPKAVDPALRRGGRLSRTIALGLPDVEQRLRILQQLTRRMPLRDVDLEDVAIETEGYSGADLKALLQQAALESMVRTDDEPSAASGIAPADVKRALGHR